MSLVVAVQLCAADCFRAAKLVDLLCHLEKHRRSDVSVMFVRTEEAPAGIVADAINTCSKIFDVEDVVVNRGVGVGAERWVWRSKWKLGCNAVWQGAADHFAGMDPRWTTLFLADGGNGVPLHCDWIDLLLADHEATLRAGLLVTGGFFEDDRGSRRVAGNLVVDRQLFSRAPGLLVASEPEETWEERYEALVIPHMRVSSLVRYDRGLTGLVPEMFGMAGECSVWWHGCRSGNFVDLAREHLIARPEEPYPTIIDNGPATAYLAAGDYKGQGELS